MDIGTSYRLGGKVLRNDIKEKIYASWLDSICWLNRSVKHKLLSEAGSAVEIYKLSDKVLLALIGEKDAERIKVYKSKYLPADVWEFLSKKNINYTYIKAADFPKKLTDIPDKPFGIFYKGELPQSDIPAVAIIGARKCSQYGRIMAEYFSKELALSGINIISGMALGIDGISQSTAIKAGGKSYGVLGCGVEVIYPKENQDLYEGLIQNGGVISEYPPMMQPNPVLFPPRNRIISAFSDAVLVVEAREKSGTLITVDMALEQGKDVYAVPGRCSDSLSIGCNKLLRQGAGAAVTVEDFIADMGWDKPLKKAKAESDRKLQKLQGVSKMAREIYEVLEILPISQDDIINRLRQNENTSTVSQICQGIMELEINKMVKRTSGGIMVEGI